MPRQPRDRLLFDVHNHGINLESGEIYLHSNYNFVRNDDDDEPGVDYRQATTFIKNIHMLDRPPYRSILVHLHSIGGCWDNGMAMYNAIQFATPDVIILTYAQASSMSGIILQAAKVRVMMPDCHFLMHHGLSGVSSDHPFAVYNDAKRQKLTCKRMLQIFSSRAIVGEFFKKRKSSDIAAAYRFFDRKLKKEVDWYLTAEEAHYYGLCDGVLGTRKFPEIASLRKD